ncbi:telomere-protecting terminal protein Tpg [Streptomyces californicus]|uniref:telomere-protecting terminal protein Tpg n=1 Tax=Streptomyces californicus TaxID=67351 RepID=UPI0033F00EE4
MARTIHPENAARDDAMIAEALERAGRETFTTQPPRTVKGQINYLLRQLGSAKAVAAEVGVTADSVNRYRRGTRKNPPKRVANRITNAVRARWQPRVRQRARRRAAATTGVTVEFRAQFGYKAPVGTTDEMRLRLITLHLPARYATRLFDAQAGTSSESPNEVLAEAAQELYFQTDTQTGAARAQDLEVEITNIDYIAATYT